MLRRVLGFRSFDLILNTMKKRLLHIVLWLDYGGLEKIVYDFSKSLRNDYEVYVVALEKGGRVAMQLHQEGIPVHVLGKRPGKFDVRLLLKLIKLIKKLQVQVIHSHSGCIMYAALAGKLAGVANIVHTEHGRYLPDSIGRIWEDRFFSRLISKYVCVSKELTAYMQKIVRVPDEKLATIINGVSTSHYYKYPNEDILKIRAEYNIQPDAIVVGTICRFIPQKNVGFLIDWMKNNHNIDKNIFLYLVGDGPQFDELVEKASGISMSRVKFFGVRKDIPDLLNIFDIFTLVSTTEGTSLTIMEAMSTQLPVIVSDVGGNKDLIDHGKTGYLFECNNQQSFKKYLDKIISNQTLAKEMGKKAREKVKEKYSFDVMLNRYRNFYG